jgi:hypothetical protein
VKKRDRRLAKLMDLSELFALKMSIDDSDEFLVLHFGTDFISATATHELDKVLAEEYYFVGVDFRLKYLLYHKTGEGGEKK